MAQFLRPNGDDWLNLTSWPSTSDTNLALYSTSIGAYITPVGVIDETSPNDTGYMVTGKGAAFTGSLTLTNPASTPGAGTGVLRLRICRSRDSRSETPMAGGTAPTILVSLEDPDQASGAGAIVSWSGTAPEAWTTVEINFDALYPYDNIGWQTTTPDYSRAVVRISIDGHGGSPSSRRGVAISWVEVEVPDASNDRTLTLNQTLGDFGLSATAKTKIKGSLGQTLGDFILEPNHYASLSQTLGDFALSAQANVPVEGQLSQTIGNFSLDAQAFAGSPVQLKLSWARLSLPVPTVTTLQLDQALGDFALSADAKVKAKASLDQTIGDFGLSADAGVRVDGELSATIGDFGLSAEAKAAVSGALSATIGDFTLSSTAVAWVEADLDQTIGDFGLSSTAAVKVKASLNATIEDFIPVYGARLLVEVGNVLATGQTVGLYARRDLGAAVGALALSGHTVGLRAIRRLAVSVGELELTGESILLSTGALNVTTGALALTGEVVSLIASRRLSVTVGALSLTGQVIDLSYSRRLVVTGGALSLTGENVLITQGSEVLQAVVGEMTLTGGAVTLTRTGWSPVEDVTEIWTPVEDEAEVWTAA